LQTMEVPTIRLRSPPILVHVWRATQLQRGVPPEDLVFLGFPDGRLSSENATALSASLKAQIDAFEPDIVLFPHPNDFNHDHAVIGTVLDGVLGTRGETVVAYEYLVHYKLAYPRPRKLAPNLYLSPPKPLTRSGDQWMTLHLSQSVEELKKKAIFTYQSQMQSPELGGIMDSYVRRNELLVISKPAVPAPPPGAATRPSQGLVMPPVVAGQVQ
jgi:N-acetylglucosamine malate deacetylase 1